MVKIFALAALVAAAGVSAQVDAGSINGCLKDCVLNTGKSLGCVNENDVQGSVNCICGDKKKDFTSQAAGCILGGCPDQLGGGPALLEKLCKEGLKDNHW